MPNTSASILVIGDSGSGKSVLTSTYADGVWRKYKVKTRLYSFDLAGWSAEMQALIDVGVVEAWRVCTRDPDGSLMLISETLIRAASGWWPEQVDPKNGDSPAGVRILPNPSGWRGAVIYDGITSMCSWSMMEMGARAAKGILGGEAGNMKTVESGDLKMAAGNRASVGFTQNKSREWVMLSAATPGLVAPPVFTSLEQKVLDSDTKLPLYGPQLAGQAKAVEALSWFGPKLGALGPLDVKEGAEVKQEWRLYLKDYCWPQGDTTPHKCDARIGAGPRGKLPAYLSDGAGNGSLEKFNLWYFLELREKLQEEARAAYAAQYEDAPGIGASTIKGAGGTVATVAPAAPAPPTPGGPTPGPRLNPRVAAARAAMVAAPPAAPTEAEIKKVEAELAAPQVAGITPVGASPVAPPPPAAQQRVAPPGARPPARAPVAIPRKS
jgi:hypothetical protein